MVWSSLNGPGKPYCRMPEGLTGEVGMGTGPEAPEAGTAIGEEEVDVAETRAVGVTVCGVCLGLDE